MKIKTFNDFLEEQTIEETVSVSDERYQGAHGKKPSGTGKLDVLQAQEPRLIETPERRYVPAKRNLFECQEGCRETLQKSGSLRNYSHSIIGRTNGYCRNSSIF